MITSQGKDKLVVKTTDSITGSAGLLFGYNQDNSNIPRAIRLYGSQSDLVEVSFGDVGSLACQKNGASFQSGCIALAEEYLSFRD